MINDDKIAEMIADCASRTEWVSVVINREQALAALLEFQQSRALVTELRAENALLRIDKRELRHDLDTQIDLSERQSEEIQKSRALITQLQALADRMRTTRPDLNPNTHYWSQQLDSLLSAHGTQETGSELLFPCEHGEKQGLCGRCNDD